MPLERLLVGRVPWGPAVGETMDGELLRRWELAPSPRRLCTVPRSYAVRVERAARLAAGEWRDGISEVGEVYFWHTGTGETTFSVPEGFRDRGGSAYRRFAEQIAKAPGGAAAPAAATPS